MGYTPPAVGVANSAADVAYMYRDYADKNGGDTEANRSAAIDYLRQSGVSDATIGSAYDSYLAKGGYQAPAEAASYLVPGGFGGEMIDSRTLGGGTPGGGMDSAEVFTGYAKPLLISSGAQPSGSVTAAANTPQIDGLYSPDGHPKLLHLWPVKLLQAGRSDVDYTGVAVMREAASFKR